MLSPAFFRNRIKKTAALVALFFTLATMIPSGTAEALSLSDEKQVGRQVLEIIRRKMPLVEDGDILTYIRNVGNRIAQQVGPTTYQYQFFLVDQPVPNAFAIPGGYIFIYRGLIEMMSNEGELASIFSHELAHIQARHIHRSLDEAKILTVAAVAGMIGAIFLGGGAGPAVAAGSMGLSQSAALAYSRAHEMEADQLGFRYLCAAGYDPKDMALIMHKMDQLKWTGSSSVPSYLSTHPNLGERVLYLDDMATGKKPSPKKQQNTVGDFPLLQAALIADHGDQAKAFERFRSGMEKGEKPAIFGMGRFLARQGNLTEALRLLQEAARQIQSPFVLSSLGDIYYRLGRIQEAKKTFESALFLDPSASIVHYRLAVVLHETGQNSEAIDHLMSIEELSPMFPEVDYQLGILLGQTNRIGMAHYYLGRYYEQKLNWSLAIMHYKKAKANILDSPAKIEEITAALKQLESNKKESPFKSKK